MKDFKLKLVLSLLGGIVFSFIFILLAFAVPVKKNSEFNSLKPKGLLEEVSQAAKNK